MSSNLDKRASTCPEERAAFEHSNEEVDFVAKVDTQFVLGSAVPNNHNLAVGYYSVHTSRKALQEGEA